MLCVSTRYKLIGDWFRKKTLSCATNGHIEVSVLIFKHLLLWLFLIDFNVLVQIQYFSISASTVLSAVAASTLDHSEPTLKASLLLRTNKLSCLHVSPR